MHPPLALITFTVLLPVDAVVVMRLLVCARKHLLSDLDVQLVLVISFSALKPSVHECKSIVTIILFAKKLLRIESKLTMLRLFFCKETASNRIHPHNTSFIFLQRNCFESNPSSQQFVSFFLQRNCFVVLASCLCWYHLGTDSHNHLTL